MQPSFASRDVDLLIKKHDGAKKSQEPSFFILGQSINSALNFKYAAILLKADWLNVGHALPDWLKRKFKIDTYTKKQITRESICIKTSKAE